MKFFRIIFLFFIFISHQASAGLVISSWRENALLTDDGKMSEILIRGQVRDIPSNQAISSFGINFGQNENIKIKRVISDDNPKISSKEANYSFVSNILNIKLPQGKKNGEMVSIYFSYDQKYPIINQFLRQEAIYVPSMAVGARTKVVLNFSNYLESATFNPNVSKNGNSFVYSGVVPKNGVQEIIKLTPAQSNWNVAIKGEISASQSLGKVIAKVPVMFQSAHQKVSNYNITTSSLPLEENMDGDSKSFIFDTTAREILIDSTAQITTGVGSRGEIKRNPADYLSVTDEDKILLTPILQKIQNYSGYGNIPLYAKIGNFVNKFIKYDISYTGKLPSIKSVMQNRIGVCTEYAQLFTALARLAGIPAIAVDGIACGEYGQCQGHSWNMIYYNNQWLEVDPTWDLMSGIVSSSHIYISDFGKSGIEVKYLGYTDKNITSKVEAQMSLVK